MNKFEIIGVHLLSMQYGAKHNTYFSNMNFTVHPKYTQILQNCTTGRKIIFVSESVLSGFFLSFKFQVNERSIQHLQHFSERIQMKQNSNFFRRSTFWYKKYSTHQK